MEALNDDAIARLLEDSDADLSDGEFGDFEIDMDDEFVPDLVDEEVEISSSAAPSQSTEEGPVPTTSSEPENRPQPPETREKKWKNRRMEQRDLQTDETLLADYEDEKGPLEAFLEYLPMEFWRNVAENSCLYSVQKRGDRSVRTTTEEQVHLAGIHLVMSCLRYPQIRMYWQKDFNVPIISDCMSRDRFFELRNYLHFVDNEGSHDADDRLWKVKPILEAVKSKLDTLPRSAHLSLDEQMIPFSGKCMMRQYVPSKPNPLGLKSFVLASPDGLVLDFKIYSGKGTVCEEDLKMYGLGASIVKHLTTSLPANYSHCLYTDRFFTSIKSVDYLLEKQIYQTGTVMKNRVGPVIKKMKEDKKLKRGEFDEKVRDDDNICCVKWMDNKSVLMLSSFCGSGEVVSCKRWCKAEKKKIDVAQPLCIKLYNEKMGGVDLCDRYMAYYRTYIRTRKWPVRLFNHFVDLVVVNCWVMYCRWCRIQGMKTHLSLLEYKLHVGKALINYREVNVLPRKRGRPSTSFLADNDSDDSDEEATTGVRPRKVVPHPIDEVRFDDVGHLTEFRYAKNASKCRYPGCKSKTRNICLKCNLYLCVLNNNCHKIYHTK